MSDISRRRFLAASLAGCAATTMAGPKRALAAGAFTGYPDGMGVLVDLTRSDGLSHFLRQCVYVYLQANLQCECWTHRTFYDLVHAQRSHATVVVTEEAFGVHRVDALAAFLVG